MTPTVYSTPEPNRTPVTIEPRPLPHEDESVYRDVTDEPGTFYREGLHPVYLALAGVTGCLLGLVALTVFAWWML